MESVRSRLLTRTSSIQKGTTALLIIDVQNGTYSDKEQEKRPDFYRQATEVTLPYII